MNEELDGLEAKPQSRAGLDRRPAGGETLVHDPATGQVHVLNAMAARVLARCDGATSAGTIVDEIVAQTGVDRERAARDVLAVIVEFRTKELVS